MTEKNKNTRKRARMSDAQLVIAIKKELSKNNTGKSNLYEQMRTNTALGKQRFLKLYDRAHSEWVKLKDKAQTDGIYQTVKEAARNGLKTKVEKQLHIQQMIDKLQSDIDAGVIQDYVFVKGQLQLVNKVLNVSDKAAIMRTMKDLYTELNKMEGDYAPAKVENTGALTINWEEKKSYEG